MWKDKGLQLVMLPTKDSIMTIDSLVKSKTGLLHRLKSCSLEVMCSIYEPTHQYLYLLSDEGIKVGDWMFSANTNEIEQCIQFPSGDIEWWFQDIKKVIAASDPSLNIPQFPSSFLEEYVKRYNSKQSMEVELAYEEYDHEEEWSEIGGAYETSKERVTLNPDNTISIRFKEEKKYSRSDVEKLCGEAFDAGEAYRTGSCDLFKQIHPDKHEWIKENLK